MERLAFSNNKVTEYLQQFSLEVGLYDDTRPWGAWYIIDSGESYQQSRYYGIESDASLVQGLKGSFDKKILKTIPGTLLSLQYHGTIDHPGHSEIWLACTKMRAVVSKKSAVGASSRELEDILQNLIVLEIEPGGQLYNPGGFIHALANPFDSDVFLIESRISQIQESSDQREANIVRIYDQTQREGTPVFPKELFERVMNSEIPADYYVKSGKLFVPHA